MATTETYGEKELGASADMLSRAVHAHYRCPDNFLDFRLGGQLASVGGPHLGDSAVTALRRAVLENGGLTLPFNPTAMIDDLRLERYPITREVSSRYLRKLYYLVRPALNVSIRKHIQRYYARNWRNISFPRWPVDTTVENICETLLLASLRAKEMESVPFVWFWPKGARGCVMLTHDVETKAGLDHCADLMDLDDSFGLKASFQLVPEKCYRISPSLIELMRARGFGVGIQDVNHDGRLFDNRKEFLRRAAMINRYASEYGAKGFRAAVLYRKPEWYDALEFSYDMSFPNVAHLDPQRGGCCTVTPYFIGDILELPLTTTQDYTLFHVLDQRSIDLWKAQIELILAKNGLVSFIVHPDYLTENDTKSVYTQLLAYLGKLREKSDIWFALPDHVDDWWRARNKMSVVRCGSSWRIEGAGAERASLAYATNHNGELVYEVAGGERLCGSAVRHN